MQIVKRARIFVHAAIVLIGVIDEYGVLDEGEVFVSFHPMATQSFDSSFHAILEKNNETGAHIIANTSVLVYRNPAYHPSDIQRAKARSASGLHDSFLKDYVNVIVFSKKDSIPFFSKLAGGDLDGDVYSIIFDSNLVEEFSPCTDVKELPEDLLKKAESKSAIQIEDRIAYFASYFLNYQLGVIANCWLAMADRSLIGVFDPKVLKLASKYLRIFTNGGVVLNLLIFTLNSVLNAIEVDSAKTEQHILMERELRPEQYPGNFDSNTCPQTDR